MVSLGTSDFVGYAARGGDVAQVPKPVGATLGAYFTSAIQGMVGGNPVWKGVVSTVPDILALPYFNFIPYNAIPLDAASATALNTQLGAGFNAAINGAAGGGLLTTTEATARQLTWAAGANPILINDSSLTDLLPIWQTLVNIGAMSGDDLNMNGIPDAIESLSPYRYARMAVATDKAVLGAQPVLGVAHPVYTTAAIGVSWPLEDQYILTGPELVEYETARATLNAVSYTHLTLPTKA